MKLERMLYYAFIGNALMTPIRVDAVDLNRRFIDRVVETSSDVFFEEIPSDFPRYNYSHSTFGFYSSAKPDTSYSFRPEKKDEKAIVVKTISNNWYDTFIAGASKKYNVPEEKIRAVIHYESTWNHKAVSEKGAQGLMQLMPSTAKDMGVNNPLDPRQNIYGGTKYLDALRKIFGEDWRAIHSAYHRGPGRIDGLIKKYNDEWWDKLPKDTKSYTSNILEYERKS